MAAIESRVLKVPAAKPKAAKKHFDARLELEATAVEVHEDMKNGIKGSVPLDARNREAFAAEHIRGAMNLWHVEIEKSR
jgi:hypothetical protein